MMELGSSFRTPGRGSTDLGVSAKFPESMEFNRAGAWEAVLQVGLKTVCWFSPQRQPQAQRPTVWTGGLTALLPGLCLPAAVWTHLALPPAQLPGSATRQGRRNRKVTSPSRAFSRGPGDT